MTNLSWGTSESRMTEKYLIVDTVEIDVDGSDIKKVKIGGRGQDIFRHPEVERWIEDNEGRLSKIEGDLLYRGIWYDFQVGYNRHKLGSVKVKRKGEKTGEIETVRETFEELFRLYREHFMGVG